ncbi:hypothetical protein Poli38472_008861 [Pythium oligandrum]|uniref:Heat shock factor-binding protein 1 n=1 Tax=Pythium oligandrum TaxID=41045 RepID=A0A8K1C4J9_PYTOL|nr:hypothetical protein Poli38472_008861 [Pythium oligandrum]|eukprot:TMW56213.1 hypothetical protein Poli38472_008861 [Pythium oligandrum]
MSANDGAKAAGVPPTGAPGDGQDLTVFVQSLLEQMQSRFTQMSEAIIGRNILYHDSVDWICHCMGTRIDDLEKSIADLMDQTNEDGAEKADGAAKDKGESV